MSAYPPSFANQFSLFGKLPGRADFVRERCGEPGAQELDAWLVRAAEQLSANKLALPESGVGYAYCSPRGQQVVIGVLAPSRDQIGRSYPVTIFQTLPRQAIVGRLAALLPAYRAFSSAALACLRQLASQPEPWGTYLDQLRVPDPNALGETQSQIENRLRADNAKTLVENMFGANAGMHCYAFTTFLTAALPFRAEPNPRSTIVLDCPVRSEIDALLWLELANRVLGPNALPSLFWLDQPAPRLLLSLGPVPAELLCVIANPKHASSRVWPLVTERVEAVERARANLPAAIATLDPTLSTDRMLRSLVESAKG